MASQADKDYADLMVEINLCLKEFLYQTEPEATQATHLKVTQATHLKATQPKVVSATLPGAPVGSFVRRLPLLKMPHCGGCNNPITDSEYHSVSHRVCITHLFKRNSIAWKKAIYLAPRKLSSQ